MRRIDFGPILITLGALALIFAGYGINRGTALTVSHSKGTIVLVDSVVGAKLELQAPDRALVGQEIPLRLVYEPQGMQEEAGPDQHILVRAAIEEGKLAPAEPVDLSLGKDKGELMTWSLREANPGVYEGTVIVKLAESGDKALELPYHIHVSQFMGMDHKQHVATSMIFLALGIASLVLGYACRQHRCRLEA